VAVIAAPEGDGVHGTGEGVSEDGRKIAGSVQANVAPTSNMIHNRRFAFMKSSFMPAS
jgi:hypothetical protein